MPFMPSVHPIPSPKTCEGQVSIGVVEHAMFWDLPPLGTIDVVCNRALGVYYSIGIFFREPSWKGGGEK